MGKHISCEYMMWHGLPVIRREIAECIIKKYGLNQFITSGNIAEITTVMAMTDK
ncbi:unnamed protein product, partial [marine sediment metagenome]